MNLPQRKHPRLKNYDYSSNGCYHIVICIENKSVRLSTVGRGLAPAAAEVRLTKYGRIFKEELLALEQRYSIVKIDKYCIMPDHVHILLSIDDFGETAGASPRPTVDGCVRIVKSISARRFNKVDNTPGRKVFQTSFYDEIIGSSAYYEEVWRYIDENPMKWLITKQKNNK